MFYALAFYSITKFGKVYAKNGNEKSIFYTGSACRRSILLQGQHLRDIIQAGALSKSWWYVHQRFFRARTYLFET